jgi:hypothetical protein
MSTNLPPIPGPLITKSSSLTAPWLAWFYQLQQTVSALSGGIGGSVPATRAINTIAPLAGGGTLAADLTLSVALFGAGAAGVVPASGGGTVNFLRADGNWVPPTGGGPWTLTAVDRMVASNAGASQTGARVFLEGANAGANSTISDIIALGDNALAGGITDATLVGSLVIGSGSFPGLFTSDGGGPITAVGFNIAPLLVPSGAFGGNSGLALLGDNIANKFTGTRSNQNFFNTVGIGSFVFSFLDATISGSTPQNTVAIGWGACSNVNNVGGTQEANINQNVIIGTQAVSAIKGTALNPPNVAANVCIGYRAGQLGGNNPGTTFIGNVIIGASAGDSYGLNNCTLIGNNAITNGSTNTSRANIGIGGLDEGNNSLNTGEFGNIVIGNGAQNAQANTRCVLIGIGCGRGSIAAASDQFLLETFDPITDGTRRGLLYGLLSAASPGGLVVGFSTQGTNRDLPGFNILKILNGSKTGVNPVGGGFLYVSAGALHYVGTAGTDTPLAVA